MSQRTAVLSFIVIVVGLVVAAAIVENALGEDDPLVYIPVGAVCGLAIGMACKRLLGKGA
jgi:hypothetical protein